MAPAARQRVQWPRRTTPAAARVAVAGRGSVSQCTEARGWSQRNSRGRPQRSSKCPRNCTPQPLIELEQVQIA